MVCHTTGLTLPLDRSLAAIILPFAIVSTGTIVFSAAVDRQPEPPGGWTFNRDIAPIIFRECAGCHRPGQSAPFSLLSYADVRKHASDIARLTARRLMPPWLPEPGHGDFAGERRLTDEEIGRIGRWVAGGAPEGADADLPPRPVFTEGWQLGTPDQVIRLPEPFQLAAEGRDVYRNFAIPIELPGPRYVRGVEFRPLNPAIVHHAFIKVDPTGQSRRLDAGDLTPGFGGMQTPARMPEGHFLGWQPGRRPAFVPPGLAWRLDPGSDLVLETHLSPTGKPETLQAEIGLYLTNAAPTRIGSRIVLTSYTLDIPAGATNWTVEDRFELPVDVEILAVLPHAHYLAREMHGWAVRPDGRREELLLIKQWDFNWQGDYQYLRPVALPRGTALAMRFTYDNSTNNLRNPNHPPQPVRYGSESRDEMAELWFQVVVRTPRDRTILQEASEQKSKRLFVELYESRLRRDPRDVESNNNMALIRIGEGRFEEADGHLRAALSARPDSARAHYLRGLIYRQQRRLPEARAAFETVIRLTPGDSKAHGNLGLILLETGDLDAAGRHFQRALAINPDDGTARRGLDEVNARRARPPRP